MNRSIEQQKGFLEETTKLRTEVLEAIIAKDLDVNAGGSSLARKELLLQQGSVQQSYIDAFKTFNHDWDVKVSPKTLTVATVYLRAMSKKVPEQLEG